MNEEYVFPQDQPPIVDPNGKPHFPRAGGMTLRDFYIGMALASAFGFSDGHQAAAEWAVARADAALAAREKK